MDRPPSACIVWVLAWDHRACLVAGCRPTTEPGAAGNDRYSVRITSEAISDERVEVPHIVVVEDRAHRKHGHYAVMFAELASALVAAGCRVTALTAQGWALEGESADKEFEVVNFGPVASRVRRLGWRLDRLPPRRFSGRAGAVVRDVAMLAAARRLKWRTGADAVIITSSLFDPYIAAAVAGHGRWLMYQFARPGVPRSDSGHPGWAWPARGAAPGKLSMLLARKSERRRRARGGFARVATNNEPLTSLWRATASMFDPITLPCIACREVQPISDARERLGIPADANLALLFGAAHAHKDQGVVWQAFESLPGWRLAIAGGGAAEAYLSWRAEDNRTSPMPMLVEGFASQETRDLLHAAADLVVLSFIPGSTLDSGTLVDAISWGIPVVCSNDCFAGGLVADLELGPTFVSGDPMSLASAVEAAPRSLDDQTIRRARDRMSSRRMAILHLQALGLDCGGPLSDETAP